MQYIYTGRCAAGYVEFRHRDGEVTTMPEGEPVEVPDWLAKKLANNSHFTCVTDGVEVATRKKPGPKPKPKPEDTEAQARDADGA